MAIKSRTSVRTFNPTPLSPNEGDLIRKVFSSSKPGPFGGTVRFAILDLSEMDRTALKSMGTYGIIRNAPLFIGAIVRPGPHIFADLGYLVEETIIHLTAEGFGTCWMGGTFTRSSFAAQAGITGDEILAVITPVGRPHVKRSLMDSAIRVIAGSHNRKPWKELFSDTNLQTPLTEENAGSLARAFECVRIAPSASNKQPWRLVKAPKAVHLFLERTKGYAKMFKTIDIQSIDMGIAMYHFEAAARECGTTGSWRRESGFPTQTGWEYIARFPITGAA
jgi:nitroreductase